jgi:phospholipase D1/2
VLRLVFETALGIEGVEPEDIAKKMNWSKLGDVRQDQEFMSDLYEVLKNTASIKASVAMGKSQERMLNPIGEAIANRIESAIAHGLPFHVYMVLPVHPEGTLNTLNIMTQLHLTMQSLIFGRDSLVNRIRRAVAANKLRRKNNMSVTEASKIVATYGQERLIYESLDTWKEYLTLLNLRNWQRLNDRFVTEQIYVHSKLLIADDRIAVLGSANINDRSQLGDRDSELAVIVRDDEQVSVKLDGENTDIVSAVVHDLRTRLWKKIFGLMGAPNPASVLAPLIDKPAAESTWRTIQEIAHSNAIAYQRSFAFLARIVGKPSSIWPTWDTSSHRLGAYMPFNERFWRTAGAREESFTWDAKSVSAELAPDNVLGFFVALPLMWTAGENNVSGMNLTMLAGLDPDLKNGRPMPGSDKLDSGAQARV